MYPPARSALLATLWIAQSASLVLLNKYILTVLGFKHLYTLALSHMVITSCLSSIVIHTPILPCFRAPAHDIPPRIHCRFFVLGLIFALSLVFATQALIYMDVPSVQMTKAMNPAIIYTGSWATGLDHFSLPAMLSVAVVCGGVTISLHGAANFTAAGLAFQVTAMVLDCLRLVWLQEIMQHEDLRLDAFTTLYLLAPYATVVLWCLAAWFELETIVNTYSHNPNIAVWILGSSCLAFSLNWTSFAFIRATSALNTSLMGVIKDVLLIYVSSRLFDTPVSTVQCIGYTISVAGMLAYNHLKRQSGQALDNEVEYKMYKMSCLPNKAAL
jgi:hypothetical protein